MTGTLGAERASLAETNRVLDQYGFGPLMNATVSTGRRSQTEVLFTVCRRCRVLVEVEQGVLFRRTGVGRHWRHHHPFRGLVYTLITPVYLVFRRRR